MTMVAEYDWESDSWTHQGGEHAARTAWREAVAEIAAKAKQTLPECNGRVDSAVKIVLAGDVELLEHGQARVASQSNGQVAYHVVNGACPCQDFPKAPSGWCKHCIAAGLHQRAVALVQCKRAGTSHGATNGQAEVPRHPTHAAAAEKTALSEPVETLHVID